MIATATIRHSPMTDQRGARIKAVRPAFLLAALLWLTPSAALAQDRPDLRAPALGAASNFGQGWTPDVLAASEAIPVTDFRDAVYWRLVAGDEDGVGRDYSAARARYPDLLPELDARLSLTVNNGHPAHDAGKTPHSPEAIAAFAGFAADMVTRFPAIDRVEVGNEMNSDTFVSGPMRGAGMADRARLYT
ncbi:hypothetical protein LCGC14_2806560, partial [marine sediment metagenome]